MIQAAGRYRIESRPSRVSGPVTGRYRLRLNSIHATPESHGPLIDINDTTQGEAIDVSGDLDEFRFRRAPASATRCSPRLRRGARVGRHPKTAGGCLEQDYRQGDSGGALREIGRAASRLPADGEYRVRVPECGSRVRVPL